MVDSQADSRLGVFRGARVMITGGVGQIGSALARRLMTLGADLLLVDSMIPEYGGNFANIADVEGRVRVNISDIRDSHAMRHMLGGQDFLFNLAAQTSHADSMTRPDDDLAINCTAQLHILEACREVAPGIVIVHASTRQIYGHPRYVPVDEAHPLHPVDVNGVNKIAGEYYHILYHDVYGIKTRALRLTNVYGPGMRIKDARQNFLGIWLRLTLEGKPFEVWGGEQRRDMLYVDDAVDAFLAAAVSPATAGLALNVGGDVPRPLLDIAAALVKANGAGTYTIREFPEERKKIDVGDLVIDDRKFRELADWAPKTTLAEGIARSVEYYRSRMAQYV
ncbi:MAG TPA: NAD-dependent epimerase/dehydratase family protein [Stellaceae bacterium]|jgi:nucleoside-diphosphate-sugar epimerase